MVSDIIVPNLGLTMTEAVIARWERGEGESVKAGEVVAAIETDKITHEVEAPHAGLLHQAVRAGETRAVLSAIGCVAETRAEYEALLKTPAAPPAQSAVPSAGSVVPRATTVSLSPHVPGGRLRSSPLARKTARELGLPLGGIAGTGPQGRIVKADVLRAAGGQDVPRQRVSPLARRVAEEMGVTLASVTGTGPDGRIVKDDVLRTVNAEGGAPLASSPGARRLREAFPVTGTRKVIFERMHRSLHETAQITLTTEADASGLARLREALNQRGKGGAPKVSYNAFLVLILARALGEHPRMNASVEGAEICEWASVNVGIAMEGASGLVVTVVHEAQSLTLQTVQTLLDDLVSRARSGTLRPKDLQGGTFTLTNLGAFGVDAFTPILNPPESGILGVGRIIEKPVCTGGEMRPGLRVTLSLTFDHRVMDGVAGGRFLRTVADHVEEPGLLLMP